jgi:hypothetical protein
MPVRRLNDLLTVCGEALTQYLLSNGLGSSSDFWIYLTPSGSVGAGLRHQTLDDKLLGFAAEPAKHRVTDNRWAHLVLTYDGSNARTYIDGQLDKSILLPSGKGITKAPWQIGRKGNGHKQYGFKGKLDDLIIWNRALEEVEVLGLWTALIGLNAQ